MATTKAEAPEQITAEQWLARRGYADSRIHSAPAIAALLDEYANYLADLAPAGEKCTCLAEFQDLLCPVHAPAGEELVSREAELHGAVCDAVTLLSQVALRNENELRAFDILRQALVNYADAVKEKSRTEIIREQQRNPSNEVTAIMVSPALPPMAREKTPLCPMHEHLESLGKLEVEIGGMNCLACTLHERTELIGLLANCEGVNSDSVIAMSEVVDFWFTHHGENRVVVSYPAPEADGVARVPVAAQAAMREIVDDHLIPCAECFGDALPDVEQAIIAIITKHCGSVTPTQKDLGSDA